jgi:hypothetical protein
MKRQLAILFSLIPLVIFGQLSVSGEFTPSAMLRISDGSLINLPFRLGHLNVNYALGDFEMRTNTSVETRWQDLNLSEDLVTIREAYINWYPSFGEVKLGKMIHAWGATDGNNPTDNLSPYDFYYMFMSGTDRKIGTLSLSSLIYLSDFRLELVILPDFVENRIPYNEEDFPIQIELPPNAMITDPEQATEIAAKVKYAMGLGDVSVSLFDGYDHMLSSAGIKINPTLTGLDLYPQLSYRKTRMYGLDGVLFPGNWTIRGELGYFQTKTPDLALDASLSVTEASYLQSVLQVEYAFANGIQLMGQFISTDYGDITTTFTPDAVFQMLPDEAKQSVQAQMSAAVFQAGMGTPFAMISERVLMLSSMLETLDNSLELTAMAMVNLEETGTMTRIGASYAIMDGLKLDTGISYFIGGDEEGNAFKELEDFSNLTLGMSYIF